MKVKLKLAVLVLGAALGWSCSKSSSSAPAEGNQDDLESLKLSQVLLVSLPDSVLGKGTASSLALSGGMSYEACEVRSAVKQVTEMFQMTSSTLCMLEGMGIKAGIKWVIKLAELMSGGEGGGPGGPGGGPEDMGEPPFPPGDLPLNLKSKEPSFDLPEAVQVWIDNSKAGELIVYMCTDGTLNNKFRVVRNATGSKGSVITKGSFGDFAFHSNITFDKDHTAAGVTSMNVQDKMDTSGDGFASMLDLVLDTNTGLSKIAAAHKGTFGESSFADSFAAKFKDAFGMALHHQDGQSAAKKSYFDGAGNNVSADATEDFEGDLKTTDADLAKLPLNFEPVGFAEGDWDCTGTTEFEMSGEPDDSLMEGCMDQPDFANADNCNGAGFMPGVDFEVDPDAFFDPYQGEE